MKTNYVTAVLLLSAAAVSCDSKERERAEAEVVRLQGELGECSAALAAARDTPEARAAAAARAEAEVRLRGEDMDYREFFARSRTGLPGGKRYRVWACMQPEFNTLYSGGNGDGFSPCLGHQLVAKPAFDDPAVYREFLKSPPGRFYATVSVQGGRVVLHAVSYPDE